MSTHYLVSHFTNEISDVVASLGSPPQTKITGNYIVRVPDDVSVQNPTNLADLLTKKYAGILGSYGLFTQVIYDDMLDESGVDNGNSTGVTLGKNASIGLYPQHGAQTPVIQTTPYGIVWGGPGSGPPQAVVTYELFEYVDADDKDEPYQRFYREVPVGVDVDVEISFNNGGAYMAVTDKNLLTIPVPNQGTQVILKFTRTTDIDSKGRILLGSWAVLF
jgi:hypothetical protein